MNRITITATSLAASAGIFLTGCENLTPGENAAFAGGLSGLAAGGIARAAGASTSESLAIGAVTGAVVGATVFVISKYQANERQRRIAEQRARVYYGRLSQERKTTLKKKKVRYIAVDTVRSEKTSPRAKKTVMIWDTQSESIVGNNVYDVEKTPTVGQPARFETYSAQYVGTGQ